MGRPHAISATYQTGCCKPWHVSRARYSPASTQGGNAWRLRQYPNAFWLAKLSSLVRNGSLWRFEAGWIAVDSRHGRRTPKPCGSPCPPSRWRRRRHSAPASLPRRWHSWASEHWRRSPRWSHLPGWRHAWPCQYRWRSPSRRWRRTCGAPGAVAWRRRWWWFHAIGSTRRRCRVSRPAPPDDAN